MKHIYNVKAWVSLKTPTSEGFICEMIQFQVVAENNKEARRQAKRELYYHSATIESVRKRR